MLTVYCITSYSKDITKTQKFNLCIRLILKCIWFAIWLLNSTPFPQRVNNDKNIYNWIIMTKNKRKTNRRILLQDIVSFIFTSYRIKIYFKIYLQKCDTSLLISRWLVKVVARVRFQRPGPKFVFSLLHLY